MKIMRCQLVLISALLAGCASVKREEPPKDAYTLAEVPGFPGCRIWGDQPPASPPESRDKLKRQVQSDPDYSADAPIHFLAISGGAQEGAFGAGVLSGWTVAGDRPNFQVVTGISSGSLLAPFAFLGPDYDFAMKELFSEYDTKAVMSSRYFSTFFRGASLSDNKKLRKILSSYFTPIEMKKVALEYAKGRKLYIGTTNLDSIRPVIWDVGAIAASGHPDAYERILDVILASAAFPGVFPPVLFDVEQNGRKGQEMHVDGGLTSQVFYMPLEFDIKKRLKEIGLNGQPHIYILRNAVILPKTEHVKPRTIPILRQTAYSLVNTMALMNMEYIYLDAQDNDMEFHLAYIPPNFRNPDEPYDPPYMNELFKLGYERAQKGYPWKNSLPKFQHEQ